MTHSDYFLTLFNVYLAAYLVVGKREGSLITLALINLIIGLLAAWFK